MLIFLRLNLIKPLLFSYKKRGIKKLTQNNKELYERRHLSSPVKKIKHLKIGFIIAIVIGTIFIAIKAFEEISIDLINYQMQQNRVDFDNNLINYDEYDERRNYLNLKRSEVEFMASMASNTAKISLNIAFAFIMVSLLSISFDEFFDKKIRRLSLIITIVLLLFVMYSIFIPTQILFSPYYY